MTGWRRNYPLYGKPDFVFSKERTAIFVDGCFWHGHNCRNTIPRDNGDYWARKVARNRERDRLVTAKLEEKKWMVIRLWECELKTAEIPKRIEYLFAKTA